MCKLCFLMTGMNGFWFIFVKILSKTSLKRLNFAIQRNSHELYSAKALQRLYGRMWSGLIEILNQFWGESS